MSLLLKIESFNYYKPDLFDSIAEQLYVVFSNRGDQYWSYDAFNKRIVNVGNCFKHDLFSKEFLLEIARSLEVIDSRLTQVVCSWTLDADNETYLTVKFFSKAQEKYQILSFKIHNL